MTQLPRTPDTEAQRAAIRKLQFLVGKWDGEARIYRKPDESVVLKQTEEAQFKLGGLLLQIEGIGRTKDNGQPVLQALGVISYDDERSTYHMRAYNDGRFLETDVEIFGDGLSFKWSFALGEIKTNSLLRINEAGEWTEFAEISIGSQPARKFMELTVRRVL